MSDPISRRKFVGATAALGMAGGVAAATGLAQGAESASASGGGLSDESNIRRPSVFEYGYHEEPYVLDPGPHLFIDWRYLMPGRSSYTSPSGQGIDLFGENLTEKLTVKQITRNSEGAPSGVRIVLQPAARKIGPIVRNDRPWEYMIMYNSLHFWDGKWRLYYETMPPNGSGTSSLLCYAESSDGKTWRKPNLGLVEFEGTKNKDNNIVYGAPLSGHGFHGSSVFVDPSASPDQRVKCVYMAQSSDEEYRQFKEKYPNSVTPIGDQKHYMVRCGASPDGIRDWRPLPGAILCHMSDTGNVVNYDPFLKRYVAHVRMSFMNRRVIGRSEGTSLNEGWPAPEMVLWQHPQDDPADDYYTNSAGLYPGTRTMHLMFPTIYRRRYDNSVIRIASSLDGKVWNWISGDDAVTLGKPGSWDGGSIFAGTGLTEFGDDEVALPYVGFEFPHKFPRIVRVGQIGLAVWQKERLAAIEADDEGEFSTTSLKMPDGTLHLNFRTERNGYVKVEMASTDGRTFDDCDVLRGDELKRQVTWKGDPSLGRSQGEDFVLRFRMKAAKLYSFEFR